MKKLGLFALVLPFSKLSPAQATPVTANPGVLRARDLQCDQAQDLVEREGHVTLTTVTDDLYVSNPEDCANGRGERAYIATSDSPTCLVGYRCDSN